MKILRKADWKRFARLRNLIFRRLRHEIRQSDFFGGIHWCLNWLWLINVEGRMSRLVGLDCKESYPGKADPGSCTQENHLLFTQFMQNWENFVSFSCDNAKWHDVVSVEESYVINNFAISRRTTISIWEASAHGEYCVWFCFPSRWQISDN